MSLGVIKQISWIFYFQDDPQWEIFLHATLSNGA